MSSASPFADESLAPSSQFESFETALRRTILSPVQFVSFWLAILLPLTYLPLLVGGLSTQQLPLFALLLAANAIALVLGHDYGRA